MPRQKPTLAEAFAAEKERQKVTLGDAFAERLGRPPGGKRMSDNDLVDKFLLKDPAVTPEMVEKAKLDGATPDDITRMLHPDRESTYTIGVVGTDEQIKEAARLARLAAKRQAEQAPVDPNAFLSESLGPLMPQGAPSPAQPMLTPPAQTEPMMGAEPPAPEMQEMGAY